MLDIIKNKIFKLRNRWIISRYINNIKKNILFYDSNINHMLKLFQNRIYEQHANDTSLCFSELVNEYGDIREQSSLYSDYISYDKRIKQKTIFKIAICCSLLSVLFASFFTFSCKKTCLFINGNTNGKQITPNNSNDIFVSENIIIHNFSDEEFYSYIRDDNSGKIVCSSDPDDFTINENGEINMLNSNKFYTSIYDESGVLIYEAGNKYKIVQ